MTIYSCRRLRLRSCLLAATMMAGTVPGIAQAQTSSTTAPQTQSTDEAATSNGFDIVVTARKKEENLQEVPLTISALSADTIQKTDTKTLYDLASRTPGLYYGTSGGRNGGTKLQIRNFSTGTSGGSKASVFIDGVFVSGDYTSTPLANLDRIEVLKGPQSAYFGRSTFVGAVNFVTKDPGDKFEGRMEGLYAEYGEVDLNGYVTTPILGDKITNTVTGRYYSFHGPNFWRTTDGYHLGDESTRGVTDKLVIRPFDGLTLRWYNSYIHDRDHLAAVAYDPLNNRNSVITRPDGTVASYFSGPTNVDFSPANAPNLYQTRVYGGAINNPGIDREQFRSVLSFDAKIVGQTLSGFAAYGNEAFRNNYDSYFLGPRTIIAPNAAGVPTSYTFAQNNLYYYMKTKDNQYEVRLSSPDDWRLRYLVGYNHTSIRGQNILYYGTTTVAGVTSTPVLATLNNSTRLGIPSLTDAVFGALYFDVTKQITVSAELRHQWDNIHPIAFPTAFSAIGTNFQNTFQATLPRFNIQFKPNRNVNIYAVYAVGDNPGGFNTITPVANLPAGVSVAYGEEKLYDYEAGVKTTWLDGRLTFDIAVYRMDWKNQQVQQSYVTNYPTPGSIQALISGGAQSRVTGFEAELDARPTNELNLRATVSYGRAKYVNYCSSNYYALTGVATGLGCRSVAGFQQEGTPAFQASIFADYTRHLTNEVDGYIRADYQYRSRIYLEEWDASWTSPANIVGLRVGATKGNVGLEVFVRNLLDDQHALRSTRASYAPGVGGAQCSPAQTNGGTCPVGAYPAPITPYGQTTAGYAGGQDIAPGVPRPRQVGVKASVKF